MVEMTVAMTILAGVFLAMALAMFSGMSALASSRQRSAFLEVANAEMEAMRATPYASVGVSTTDPNYTVAYDTAGSPRKFNARDAVEVASGAPAAVSEVTTSPIKGIVVPYTVRRWVTWTDTTGGAGHQFKRLLVQVQWTENQRVVRTMTLTSVLYPGNLGVGTAVNQVPTAAFPAPSPATLPVGSSFSFDASTSSDPDAGDTLSYAWNFGDGTTGTGVFTTHAYAVAGNYTVVLTVTDSRGGSSSPASNNVTATSSTPNTPPTASFTSDGTTGTAPLTVNFTSTSTDAEGPVSSWSWNWGDGTPNGTTASAGHVFASAGTFPVTLTVTDAGGLTATSTTSIVVVPLNCDVTGGYLKNPWDNATSNEIKVKSSSRTTAINSQIMFVATTNAACTSVTAKLPLQAGTMTTTLTLYSSTGNTKTWYAITSITGDLNWGTAQTASMTGTDGSSASDIFSYAFTVKA
jgi:PKD repeat protein